MKDTALICVLLLRTICMADDPCPVSRILQGAQRVLATSIAPKELPKQIAEAARYLVPREYMTTGAQRVLEASDVRWFVSFTNCCDGPAAEWQSRMVVVEEVGSQLRASLVQNQDGSPAALVGFGAAYLLHDKLYVISEYFSRGMCLEGKVFKIGNHYKFLADLHKK